jgi:hypothetical protein
MYAFELQMQTLKLATDVVADLTAKLLTQATDQLSAG